MEIAQQNSVKLGELIETLILATSRGEFVDFEHIEIAHLLNEVQFSKMDFRLGKVPAKLSLMTDVKNAKSALKLVASAAKVRAKAVPIEIAIVVTHDDVSFEFEDQAVHKSAVSHLNEQRIFDPAEINLNEADPSISISNIALGFAHDIAATIGGHICYRAGAKRKLALVLPREGSKS